MFYIECKPAVTPKLIDSPEIHWDNWSKLLMFYNAVVVNISTVCKQRGSTGLCLRSDERIEQYSITAWAKYCNYILYLWILLSGQIGYDKVWLIPPAVIGWWDSRVCVSVYWYTV